MAVLEEAYQFIKKIIIKAASYYTSIETTSSKSIIDTNAGYFEFTKRVSGVDPVNAQELSTKIYTDGKSEKISAAPSATEQLQGLISDSSGNLAKSKIYYCDDISELLLVLADTNNDNKVAFLSSDVTLPTSLTISGVTHIPLQNVSMIADCAISASSSSDAGVRIYNNFIVNGDRTITFTNSSSGLLRFYTNGMIGSGVTNSINTAGAVLTALWYQNRNDDIAINNYATTGKNEWLYETNNKNKIYIHKGNGATLSNAIPKGSILKSIACYPEDNTVDFGILKIKYGTTSLTSQSYAAGRDAYVNAGVPLIESESTVNAGGDMRSVVAIVDDIDLTVELTGTNTLFTIKCRCESFN